MKKNLKSILPPLISLITVTLSTGFFTTYTSLKLSIDGYPNWIVGCVNASYYIGMMLGPIFLEKVINRIGHIRTFATFASLNSISVVLQSLIPGFVFWSIFRFTAGLCTSGFYIVIESWLLLSYGIKSRGRILGVYMVCLYLAQGFGQFLLNISPLNTLFPFSWAVLLSCLSLLPVCMMRSSGPILDEEASITNIIQIFKKIPVGLLGCFTTGIILSSFYSLAPIFGKAVQMSTFQISQVMGFTILGGLLLQWPIGYLSDIFNRKIILFIVTFLLLLVTLVLYKSTHFNYYTILIFMIIFGGISFTTYPLSIALTCDYFSSKNVIGVTASLLIMYGIGCILGPLLSPIFMSKFGPSGLFLFLSFISLAFLIICTIRTSQKPYAKDYENQGEYISLPHSSLLSFYIDSKKDDNEELFEDEDELYPVPEEYEDEE